MLGLAFLKHCRIVKLRSNRFAVFLENGSLMYIRARKVLAECLALLVIIVGLTASSETAQAAEDTINNSISALSISPSSGTVVLNAVYRDVYRNDNGINGNLTISTYGISNLHHVDIRMIGRNGQVLWEEYGAIDYNATRKFGCGNDVASVQARVASKNVFGEIMVEKGMCDYWFNANACT